MVVVDLAVLGQRVPERERDPEEALAADAPVGREPVDPVLEAAAHPLGVPGQLLAPGQQGVLEADGADEPLAAGQDLHRLAAVLVELDRLGDAGRGRGQGAGLAQHGRRPLPGPGHGQAGQLVVGPLGGRRVGAGEPGRAPGDRPEGAVAGRGPAAWAGPARATRPGRWGRRRCRAWRCRSPCRGRPAGGPAPAPGPRTAGCVDGRARAGRGSGRRRGGRPGPRRRPAARAGWCRPRPPGRSNRSR